MPNIIDNKYYRPGETIKDGCCIILAVSSPDWSAGRKDELLT
jgi:hypothetical protein